MRRTAIQPNIFCSNFSLFNKKFKASRSDFVWLSIYFHKDFRFLVCSFSRLPLNVIQFPLDWFVELSELRNRPTKCWFLNTGSSDFNKNIPLNDVRLGLGICQEIFGAFYASKCHYLLNFCPLSCIEVLKWLLLLRWTKFQGLTSKCALFLKSVLFSVL